MLKYYLTYTPAGGSPSPLNDVAFAPRSVESECPLVPGARIPLDFVVQAIPGFSSERREYEVVEVGIRGWGPFKSLVAKVRPASAEPAARVLPIDPMVGSFRDEHGVERVAGDGEIKS